MPPSEELFPGGGPGEPWQPDGTSDVLDIPYAAGGAYAAVAGEGELNLKLDKGAERLVRVGGPGLYELAEHERHESHRLELRVGEGIGVYAISFAAGVP